MEKLSINLTLDELDIITCMLEGYQENMPENDEDKNTVDGLVDKFFEFTDKISSLSEYLTGDDWPENAAATLSIDEDSIKKAVAK